MSHYTDIETQFKDKACLIEALMETGGWSIDQIEIHGTPTNLYGYQGDRRADVANIIIRRNFVGSASNDIGFLEQADGTMTAIISEFDRGRYTDSWMNQLKQNYAVKMTERKAKAKGMAVSKTKKQDGTIQLVLLKGK